MKMMEKSGHGTLSFSSSFVLGKNTVMDRRKTFLYTAHVNNNTHSCYITIFAVHRRAVDNVDKHLNCIRLWWAVGNIANEKARKKLGLIAVKSVLSVIEKIRLDKSFWNLHASLPLALQWKQNFKGDRDWEKALFYINRFQKERSPL